MSLLEQLNLSANNKSQLPDDTFSLLRSFIYNETGIFFQDNKRYLLESRIGRRLHALRMPDYAAYFRYVQNGGKRNELPLLVNAITINETFFFRNEAQLEVLESDILPELVRHKEKEGNRRIRIWSAACSSGDEPYTLALLVKERFQPRYPGFQFEIIGTDINTEVLDTARAGVFGAYAVRNIPAASLSKHFSINGEKYTLNPDIRRMVTYKHLNLTDRSGMMMMRGFEVIFCANVLIYFDTASKQQVVTSLYNSLNPNGYLFVGFSETLYGITQALQPVRFAKTIAYKKG